LANKAGFTVICIHLEALFAGLKFLKAGSKQDWAQCEPLLMVKVCSCDKMTKPAVFHEQICFDWNLT
jgi:hypothetical protein